MMRLLISQLSQKLLRLSLAKGLRAIRLNDRPFLVIDYAEIAADNRFVDREAFALS